MTSCLPVGPAYNRRLKAPKHDTAAAERGAKVERGFSPQGSSRKDDRVRVIEVDHVPAPCDHRS